MSADRQITLSDIRFFLETNERKNTERFNSLEKELESLNLRQKEIMTAIEALLYNNRNDFKCVEVQFKVLEANILEALGIAGGMNHNEND